MSLPSPRPVSGGFGTYTSNDLNVAAVLATFGHLPTISAESDRRAVFTFTDSPELRGIIADYAAGQCQVEPGRYSAFRATFRRQVDDVLQAARGSA